jgi:hypothetical protein
MSEEMKSKKRSMRRRAVTSMTEGNASVPEGMTAACGHGGCGPTCCVRYVGPTSHVRDHHVLHVARGVANIWGAAVLTGVAIVLTGAIAFTSVEAKQHQERARAEAKGRADAARIVSRLEMIEKAVRDLKVLCANVGDKPAPLGKQPPGGPATSNGNTTSTP